MMQHKELNKKEKCQPSESEMADETKNLGGTKVLLYLKGLEFIYLYFVNYSLCYFSKYTHTNLFQDCQTVHRCNTAHLSVILNLSGHQCTWSILCTQSKKQVN